MIYHNRQFTRSAWAGIDRTLIPISHDLYRSISFALSESQEKFELENMEQRPRGCVIPNEEPTRQNQ